MLQIVDLLLGFFAWGVLIVAIVKSKVHYSQESGHVF